MNDFKHRKMFKASILFILFTLTRLSSSAIFYPCCYFYSGWFNNDYARLTLFKLFYELDLAMVSFGGSMILLSFGTDSNINY